MAGADMSFLDLFRIGRIKSDLEVLRKKYELAQATLSETSRMDYQQLKEAIELLRRQKDSLVSEIEALRSACEIDRNRLKAEIEERRREVIVLDDEILLQSFGIYKPRYSLENSAEYEARLASVRSRQDAMVKADIAAECPANWTVNNSAAEGRRMIRDYSKLIVRSFNNECDASIVRVKFNNVSSIDKKIRKAFEILNKLGKRMSISITGSYLDLKIEELYLVYEYQVKKQEEKEEQKRLREQMREEARLMKEIEEAKALIQKEERHFAKALANNQKQMATAKTESERTLLDTERASFLQKLDELGHTKEDILYREQNTRAGYVYIISNIGSFGENIFKIGVTRRLDPVERIDELGDASVPFDFDIHALIFSDDAPRLEAALHKAFAERRLNKVNLRREYFRVELVDIETVVRENFKEPVEFTKLAEAAQFRQSFPMSKSASIGA